MSRYLSLCTLLAVALANPAQLAAQQADSIEPQPELLAAARQARQETANRLHSGIGTGSIRHLIVEPDHVAPLTTLDANIQIYFDGPKFQLRLQYATRVTEDHRPDVPQADKWVETGQARQVIIFDGKTTYSVEFSVDGHCRGDVYFDFNCQSVLRSAGVPFENPVQLWSDALDIERVDLEKAKLTQLAGGGFMGLLTKETYRMKFYFLDDFAFDLRRVSSYRMGENVPFRDCLLQWGESNGTHYVKRFVSKVSDRPPANATVATVRELEVEYKSFEANVPVDAKWFELSSVGMPGKTRFDDHRYNVDGKPKIVWFDGTSLRGNKGDGG